MKVINFAEENSIINHYMAELRDKNYQKNRFTFRHNVERIGELMAYEISKTLEYKPKTIKTPLGTTDIPLMKEEDMVIATVLRAGLPFHQASSMSSTVPTTPLSLPFVCISTVSIRKWEYMQSILPLPV